MTREELVDFCKFGLNFNASQDNDDITEAQWIMLVNNAYRAIWNRVAGGHAPKGSVVQYVDKTWTAGAYTYTLPTELKNAVIYELWYLDDNDQPYSQVNAYFQSRNLLALPLQGSSSVGFDFRIYFIPDAEKLETDNSEPQLLPPRHHELIGWEALRTAKSLADKEVPGTWQEKIDDLELSLAKEFQSRPLANRPNVRSLWSPIARPLI